jgi:polyhydroxyalkanoate synthesis regulator protein
MSVKTTKITIQVRKYGNRKLYDEEHATYVSMLDLSGLVAGGAKVQVTCDLTGRDITLETLARSLYERSKVASSETDRETVVRGLAKIIEQIFTSDNGSME